MIYSKNISDKSLLETELKKLKVLYAEELNKKENLAALQQLRTRIKLLVCRINLVSSYAMNTDNSKMSITNDLLLFSL